MQINKNQVEYEIVEMQKELQNKLNINQMYIRLFDEKIHSFIKKFRNEVGEMQCQMSPSNNQNPSSIKQHQNKFQEDLIQQRKVQYLNNKVQQQKLNENLNKQLCELQEYQNLLNQQFQTKYQDYFAEQKENEKDLIQLGSPNTSFSNKEESKFSFTDKSYHFQSQFAEQSILKKSYQDERLQQIKNSKQLQKSQNLNEMQNNSESF